MNREDLEKLFFKLEDFEDDFRPETFIVGARGIGKTYSSLSYFYKKKKKFIYMRNTWNQIKECMTNFGNPFKSINRDLGLNIKIEKEADHGLIIDYTNEAGEEIGYACDLSTFEDLKGVDVSDAMYVYFDEFIEKRTLHFDQYDAFTKMYETVNRNRELFGEAPLYCILTSNSTRLNNPILLGYNLVPTIEGMIKSGQQKYKSPDKCVILPKSAISDLKKETAHYRNIKGSKAYKEAIENEFAYDNRYGIKKQKLIEFKPLVSVDNVYIYKHKSANIYYACSSQFLNYPEYKSSNSLIPFYRNYGRYLSDAYANGRLFFSDYVIKDNLMKILR